MTADTDTEVAALWHAHRELGDPDARERLIARYSELARMIAAKLYGGRPDDSVPFDDYLQYARVGLIEALDRFELNRGASFETYSSHRIRGSILNGLSQDTELRAQRNRWREILAERRESLTAGSADANSAPMTLEDFARLAVGLAIGLILEDSAGPERPDDSIEANPYCATELLETRARVRALVDQLPPRERDIIRQHYYEHLEFREIASRLKLTKGRVSQLHSRALERIREGVNAKVRIDRKV